MSLSVDDAESEQNEIRNLHIQLESTNQIVHTLSKQLSELREQVRSIFVAIPVHMEDAERTFLKHYL